MDLPEQVWRFVCGEQACRCLELPDDAVVDMGDEARDMLSTHDEVRRHGAPRWWLSAARCRECTQAWLVGAEERQNDVVCLRRVDSATLHEIVAADRWPHDFDTYEVLLQMGANAGRSVSFVDPLGSRSLSATVSDLVQARPDITDEELARLLNLHTDLARTLRARVDLK